jgi:hypothetical protein
MADKRISQLVERVTLANNDVFPIVASGATTTNKVTLQTIDDYMQTNLDFGVTSVAMTVPTGLSVTGTPVTSTGTFVVTFTAGYSIPTNAKQTEWDTAYNLRITSATAPLGIASNVISITQSGASSNGYLSSTDWNTFNNKQNALTFGNLTEDTSSVLTITGGTGSVIGSGTTIQVKQASGSQDGFLDSADWTTFNNKQNALSGTGIVKSTGGTITYLTDNTSNWDSAYNDKINSASVTGTTTKTLTLNQQDGGTITTTWTDLDTGTVTSVGVSMPSAFSVANSPITSSGTIAITGAGTINQYIDGTGALQTFPSIISQATNLVTEVYNNSGATLSKGTVVYITGGQGNLPTISKALATGDATSAQTYGVVQNDITNMNNGYVVVAGRLIDLDTQAYANGTQLYLSGTTAGAYTSTKPYAPIHLVYVGIVVRSHPTQGVVEVKIQNGYEMDELHNVSAQSPNNNDILQYKTATGLWTKTAGTTSNIAEGSNLYYTDARSRAAISESVTGLDYNSSTGVLSTTTGYAIPTTASQTNWDAAYNDKINSAAVSGTTTKTLTLTQQDGGTITASWTDINTDAVSSVFGRTGAVVATSGDYNTDQVTEGSSNLYFTNARSRSSITLTTTGTSGAATYNSTTGVLNIPSYVGGVTSVNTLTGAVVLTTSNIAEGTNLYYTDTRARAAISLTTTGTSGAATYSGGVLNIPNYSFAETDTLASVTGRGASTSTVSSFNGGIVVGEKFTFGGVFGYKGYNINLTNSVPETTSWVKLGTASPFTLIKIYYRTGNSGAEETGEIRISNTCTQPFIEWSRNTYNPMCREVRARMTGGCGSCEIWVLVVHGSSYGTDTYFTWQVHDGNDSNFIVSNATGTPGTGTNQVSINTTDGYFYRSTGNIGIQGSITASNFSGTSSGTNTGDQTLSGLGGVPTSRTLTINGTAYDLSADRSWTIAAGVPTNRTITINGTAYDLSSDRSWSVGTVVGNSNILADANAANVTQLGGYYTGFNPSNIPAGQSSGDWGLTTFPLWTGNSTGERYSVQLAANIDSNDNIYIRKFFYVSSVTRSAWHMLLHSSNYSSYALPLSGGTMTGDILMGNNQNRIIKFRTATAWDYSLKGVNDDFFITDNPGLNFIGLYYNGGGNSRYTSIMGSMNIYANGAVNIGGATTISGQLTTQVSDTGVGTKTIVSTFERTGAEPSSAREVGIVFKDGNNPTIVGGITGIRNNSAGNYIGGLKFYVMNTVSTPATSFSNLTCSFELSYDKSATFTGNGGRIVRIDGPSNTDNYLSLHSGSIEMFIDADYTNNSGIVGTQSAHNLILRASGDNKVIVTTSGVMRPNTNGSQDLGSSSYRWATVYTSDLDMSNGIGDYTIVEGYEDLFLYNNNTGKVFKFNLTEVDKSVATPKKINNGK